jgi:hypothetical protein
MHCTCSAIIFAAIDFYLQLHIQNNEVYKTANNAYERYMYN